MKKPSKPPTEGGYCFAHGSYVTGTLCPSFPACLSAPCRACDRPVIIHRCSRVVTGDLAKQKAFKERYGAFHPYGEQL